jgi:hypothetical protein
VGFASSTESRSTRSWKATWEFEILFGSVSDFVPQSRAMGPLGPKMDKTLKPKQSLGIESGRRLAES